MKPREMDTETRVHLRELREARASRKRLARAVEVGRIVVDDWNARAEVGTPVTVTLDDGSKMETRTRSPAWMLGHGEAVVSVDGIVGGYLLSRVQVRP